MKCRTDERFPTTRRLAVLSTTCAAIAALMGCSEARLERVPPPPPVVLDNLLEIRGEYCTEPSAEVQFPLKVLYIIDQSASLQCTDSANLRFDALDDSIDVLRRRSNTEFSFVGFSSWSREQAFTRRREDIDRFLDPAGGLGPATDYQGSLATALKLLEQDMLDEDPAVLARTRYVVNFVSDGNPEPRCLAGCEDDISRCSDGEDNDGDGLNDTSDPDCANIDDSSQRPDSLYGVCNTNQEVPDNVYVDMTGVCPEYNQPRQIMQRIAEIRALSDVYSVGDISLNTVLLFSPTEVVESLCPGASTSFGYDRGQARALLQTMAAAGNGTFRDVNLTTEGADFLRVDITSLEAEQALTDLSADNASSILDAEGLYPDSDRDGLSDEEEVALNTSRNNADSDNDRYSDLFEARLVKEGFDPLDDNRPAITCPNRRDGDGDGLTDCEEEVLGTSPLLPDSDADGLLDRQEFIEGTNPLIPDAQKDVDFDGVLNADELSGGTDPLIPDAEAFRSERTVYEIVDLGLRDFPRENSDRVDERHCYDYTVRRVPLVPVPRVEEQGLNRVLVYTQERPARVAGVPGEVRVACFEAFYNGSTIKSPESGVIDVSPEAIAALYENVLANIDQVYECSYFGDDYRREELVSMVDECLPPKIALENKHYTADEMVDLIERQIDGNAFPKIPLEPYELFVPISNFDPDTDCYRPWEFDLLNTFLAEARTQCIACYGEKVVEPEPAPESP